MLKTLRTLTAVAAIAAAGLPQMANAALVSTTLTFDDVAVGALSNQYADATHWNTTFSGNTAYVTGLSNHSAPNSLYYGCQANCSSATTIVFSVGDGFDSIEFYINTLARATVGLQGANGASDGTVIAGTTIPDWQRITLGPSAGERYTTVTFTVTPGTFYIDDITFFRDDGGSTNVPEPSSMALVALALTGLAGLSRRRRPQA